MRVGEGVVRERRDSCVCVWRGTCVRHDVCGSADGRSIVTQFYELCGLYVLIVRNPRWLCSVDSALKRVGAFQNNDQPPASRSAFSGSERFVVRPCGLVRSTT